jgi:transglutaminase-like putative cysteine protease
MTIRTLLVSLLARPAVMRPATWLLGLVLVSTLVVRASPTIAHQAEPAPPPVATAPADATAPAPAAFEPSEHWYVLELLGQRAGHARAWSVLRNGNIVTGMDMNMEVKRGRDSVKISMNTEFVETPDGTPVSTRKVMNTGTSEQIEEGLFTPDGITITSTQGKVQRTRTAPRPEGQWLTPDAARRQIADALRRGDETITTRTLDPSSGTKVLTISRKVLERTTAQALGKAVPAVKWESVVDTFGGLKATELVAPDTGVPIRTEMNMGFLKMTMIQADRDLARSRLSPPELLNSTLVIPTGKIDDPRTPTRRSYVLRAKEGDLPDLPSSPTQRVERLDATSVRVIVDPMAIDAAAPEMLNDAALLAPLLDSSVSLRADDPEIAAFAADALKRLPPDASDQDKAERLRRRVHSFIENKDFSVGFATASETVRTRTGDCTEHAVLLAAALRSAKLPARVVSGLVYLYFPDAKREVFGFHMWAQALIRTPEGAQWVHLDATLPDTAYDGTHIALSLSNLNDDDTQNFLVTLAPIIGRLAIEIEEAPAPAVAPAPAPAAPAVAPVPEKDAAP